MNKQKGLTLTGMLITSILVVLALLLAFKVFPVYLEYNTIQRNFRAMAADPALRGASRSALNMSWFARTTVDNITSLSADSISYEKDASGWTISADYSVKVPLFRNVSACFDFHPTSQE